jgi:hypothetical protein
VTTLFAAPAIACGALFVSERAVRNLLQELRAINIKHAKTNIGAIDFTAPIS